MAIACMCEQVPEVPCLIHPKEPIPIKPNVDAAPKAISMIEIEDRLQLKTLQATALDLQLALREASDRLQNAQQQLNSFAQTMFEKYGQDPKKSVLDLSFPKFVSRPAPPVEG